MEEKKVKIEISKLALVFIILFGLSLLVWSFVIGVWVGTKISAKAEKEEIAMEQTTVSQSVPPEETISPPPVTNETVPPTPIKVAPPSTVKESIEKRGVVEEKKQPEYKKKEIAKIASQIKKETTPFYSLQIGAFSKKEIAERLKNAATAKGYDAFIKGIKSNGKLLYKVYVGKYSTREEAKKYISKITKDLKVEKPFIVEIK
jgi:cell division protein FtsN